MDNLEVPSAYVAVDVTESPIQRPQKSKQNRLSQTKRHTIKTQILFDLTSHRTIQIAFSDGHTHDFTLFKTIIGDSL